MYYQYNFHKARNVFAGMVQTESPYYQPMPVAPEPFRSSVGVLPGDPDYTCSGDDFDGCDSSWAVMITGCHNIFVAGAGLYSWFDTYAQDCSEWFPLPRSQVEALEADKLITSFSCHSRPACLSKSTCLHERQL